MGGGGRAASGTAAESNCRMPGATTCHTPNTGVAKHRFCRVCGIKSFYIPRSNPDGVDVNARCLDEGTVTSLSIEPFDGRHWEQHADSLTHLSEA